MVNGTPEMDVTREAIDFAAGQILSSRRGSNRSSQGEENKGQDVNAGGYAVDKALQTVAQSAAIAIQDATDLLRNVSTEESVAIGAATARWISDPGNSEYVDIINKSVEMIERTARAYEVIGKTSSSVLRELMETQPENQNKPNGKKEEQGGH